MISILRNFWYWCLHGTKRPDYVSESWLRDHQYHRDGY